MKNHFRILAFAATFIAGTSSAQHSLTVNITNLKPNKGALEVGLFNKEQGFLKPGLQFIQKKIKATGNAISYTFENLPTGNYAVAVYQDENSNGKCDTNMLGIPVEGFGFSNNVKPKFSAPNFSQTKISVKGTMSTTIKLIN